MTVSHVLLGAWLSCHRDSGMWMKYAPAFGSQFQGHQPVESYMLHDGDHDNIQM